MRKTAKKIAKIQTRKVEVLRLFCEGHTVRTIAASVGCAPSTVSTDLAAELKNITVTARNELQKIKAEQYGELIRAYREKALDGDTNAAQIYLKILAAECKTFGIDTPPMPADYNEVDNKLEVNIVRAYRRADGSIGGELDEDFEEQQNLLRR